MWRSVTSRKSAFVGQSFLSVIGQNNPCRNWHLQSPQTAQGGDWRPMRRTVVSAVSPLPAPRSHPNAHARNQDPNAAIAIVGASRGIGLALTQQVFGRFKGRVVALCRNPDEAGALSALRQFNPDRMLLVAVDTTVEDSVAQAVSEVRQFTDGRLDILLHTVGILHGKGANGERLMPETSLARLDAAFLQQNFLTNSIGPILVMKHFSPLLYAARKDNRLPSILATLTARVGSITDNGLGGWLSYRASKAAHNQALKTASVELGRRGCCCVALHPGTVDTDLSTPFQKNVPSDKLFPVDVAAQQLLDVVDSLGPDDNGSFLDYARKEILW